MLVRHVIRIMISSHMHVTHVTCTTQITDVSFVMLNNSPISCVMVKIYSCTSKRVCFLIWRLVENKLYRATDNTELEDVLDYLKLFLTQNLFHILYVVEFSGHTMGVLREVWNKVYFDRRTITTLSEQPIFKTPHQSQMILRDFDAPVDVGDYYVQRLTSYLQVNPPRSLYKCIR